MREEDKFEKYRKKEEINIQYKSMEKIEIIHKFVKTNLKF